MQAAAQKAADELQLDLSKNVVLRDEAAAHAQDAKKHMQKLSDRTAQVSSTWLLQLIQQSDAVCIQSLVSSAGAAENSSR